MNLENEFDELAKRKLQEQAFPFEEAHWLDAQRLIAADKRSRGSHWWKWTMGGIAMLALLWWLWPTAETTTLATTESAPVVPSTTATSTAPINEDTSEPAAPSNEAKPGTSEHEVSVNTITTSVEPTGTRAEQPEATITRRAAAQANTTTPSLVTNPKSDAGAARTLPSAATATTAAHTYQQSLSENSPSGTTDHRSAPEPSTTPTAGNKAMPEPTASVSATTANPDVDTDASTFTSKEQGTTLNPELSPTGSVTSTTGSVPDIADAQTSGNTTNTPGSENGNQTATNLDPENALPNIGTTGLVLTSEANTDSTLSSSGASTSSASTTPPTPVATPATPPVTAPPQPPIAPSPWELGAMVGFFQSTSSYAGGTSSTWEVSPEQNLSFGAEAMHMGRNFGWGSGLHYGTYADRLYTPAEDRSTVTYTPFWQLVPVDTSIFIVTGSYLDTASGDVIYTGQHIDATINVLRRALDSTFASVRIREARERINRTSYVELPLLLDAHVVQGRWSLGLRGGPTVGLLTQRSGSIPSNNEERNFNDVAMRTWMFGWTARAYVRYRFNSAWSVGIEPTARGQLFDSFDDNGTTRRSNAYGVMLSLSYRLK